MVALAPRSGVKFMRILSQERKLREWLGRLQKCCESNNLDSVQTANGEEERLTAGSLVKSGPSYTNNEGSWRWA